MTRFSLWFQQDTPTKSQMKPTVVLSKRQLLRRFRGSERVSLMPLRHVTSSSTCDETKKRWNPNKLNRRSEEEKVLLRSMEGKTGCGGCERFDF